MDSILQEIKEVPGVIGACVFNASTGIMSKNLPSFFKDEKIEKAGRHLIKIYTSGISGFPDLSEVTVSFQEAVISLKEIKDKNYLIVFSDRTDNSKLLSMSMHAAMDELTGWISLSGKPAVPENDGQQENSGALAAKEGAGTSLKMEETMTLMEKALAKVIGPIASIVFDDCRQKWTENGTLGMENIEKLVEIITDEIGNKSKGENFIAHVSDIIGRH